MKKDIQIKRARYIEKNNTLVQEFHFAHPIVKFTVNNIYNSDFTGSPLWDMNSEMFDKLSKTWNVSVRLMFNLPRTTHKYFIEPISENPHIKFNLMKRFLNFCEQLRNSDKSILKMMINKTQFNTQSRTGQNLRTIMLICEKNEVSQVRPSDLTTRNYSEVPDDEFWRISFLKELIEIRYDPEMLQNFTIGEIEDMIHFISTT